MTTTYDAIVVGARCGGSPTAMLLARQGHRVLLVDKATFPSDTLSTHYLHQPAVAALHRWGLLPEVVASGCPPILQQAIDFGPFTLRGAPPPVDGVAEGYCVRRTILDEILVRAAADAGVEVRQGFLVDGLQREGDRVVGLRGQGIGRAMVSEHARIVVGADGMNSLVARAVDAATTEAHPSMTCAYYSYWSGVDVTEAELYPRPDRMVIAAPTNDGHTMVISYWPAAEFREVRGDVEGHFMRALELAPDLAERVRGGRRVAPFRGTGNLPNFMRRPQGDGWALVGDAGYHKDPILALGITDAFRDAELLASAVHQGLSGTQSLASALAGYEQQRDAQAAQGFQNTLQFATLQPPPRDVQQLMAALMGNQEQTDRFMGATIGSVPAQEFFSPENLAEIMGRNPGLVGAEAGSAT